MKIDLLNPAHTLLLFSAFLLYGWLNSYVSETLEKAEETRWMIPNIILTCINVGAVLGSLIHLIIKSL